MDITAFAKVAPMRKMTFEVPDPVIVGFTWSPVPMGSSLLGRSWRAIPDRVGVVVMIAKPRRGPCHPPLVNEVESAERLLAATSGYFPYPTDPAAITIDEMALAGLARCSRLMAGLLEVHDSPDLGGLFARSLYETWVVAVYLLVGGDDAYARLDLNDRLAIFKFSKRLVEFVDQDTNQRSPQDLLRNAEQVVAAGKPDGGELRFNDLVLRVGRLLTEQGDPNAGFLERGYVSLYMPESYTTVHGGIGALKQHLLDHGEQGDAISAGPWEHANRALRLQMCSAMVGVLAATCAQRLGLPVSEVEAALADLGVVAQPAPDA